jgi:ferredoxin
MRRRWLKPLRVGIALVFLAGLTAAFVDFRGMMPARLSHWLAAVQFTPSLLALGSGPLAWLIFAGLMGITLGFGRVYCSTVCPLGLLQDVVARMAAALRPRRRLLPPAPPSRWLRYGLLAATVVTIAGGAGSIAYTHADPYSNFGRIMSGLARPLLVTLNNALVTPAAALGMESFYRVVPPWPNLAGLGPALLALLVIVSLAVWRERIYCNTLCPVGTVLGLLARGAAYRLSLDSSACTKCAECLRHCKAQCIDLRTGTIDAARCVGCFNCVAACPEHGVGYRLAWTRPSAAPAASDPRRRAFLARAGTTLVAALGVERLWAAVPAGPAKSSESGAICPPGAAGDWRFVERCTACQLCVSACPTQVLQPALLEYGFGVAGLMKPRLDYSAAYCNFDCRRCAEVCPDGALVLLPLAEKQVTRIGLARLDVEKCIVKTKGTDCAACSEHCPTKAVDTIPYGANLRLPQVNNDLCIGCGACEFACPAQPKKAIIVAGQRRHDRAARQVEGKANDPRKQADFPF